ncbi:hypothetical protein Zmor_019372 [Zophobas morio]|uniref:Ionotropic receptor n=1 Tax=Zophobas morio TaxID=2755281 RepID=A0AA38M954_9CUCU|nr:hypothetical protein Zmor_019372 [Zophobas morio]
MKKIFSLAILLDVLQKCLLILKTTDLHQCSLYSDDFWYVHGKHFLLVDRLTILVLQTEKHIDEVNHYASGFLQRMHFYHYFVTLEIHEKFLDNVTEYKDKHNLSQRPLGSSKWLQPIEDLEFLRIKLLSSDSSKGYVVIVWDVKTLHQFLNDNLMVVVEQRATYSLHFVFDSNDCQTIDDQVDDILRRFWEEFNVINIVAQTPCSSRIYIYRPFVKSSDVWGITENYSFDEIKNNLLLITNILDNFNKYPLNIGMFPMELTAVLDLPKLLRANPIYKNLSRSRDFGGLDGLMLGTLAQYLNFEVNLVGAMKELYFGEVLPNGTITPGALKDLFEGKIIYSANSRYIINYEKQTMEFTVPHLIQAICAVVPKAPKLPKWVALFRCFNKTAWLLIGLTLLVCTTFWYFARSFTKVLYCLCLLFNLVVLGIFEGYMFRTFTTTKFYPDINTLEELDKSGLTLEWDSWFFFKDNSSLIKNLERKSVPVQQDTFNSIAFHRNVATVEPKVYAEFLSTKYVDSEGFPRLHIVDECLNTFLVGHVVPKGSAFLTIFNNFITKMMEAGLTEKWLRDVFDSTVTEKTYILNKNKQSVKAFSMDDLQIAFYGIVVGYVGSFLVFLCELRTKARRNLL